MQYQEMRLRPDGETVRVYAITGDLATIWCESQFAKADQGWKQVKVTKLVPMDYDLHNTEFVSKTQAGKIKKRIKLQDAVWSTSDGMLFSHTHYGEAMDHERKLMELEEAGITVPKMSDDNTKE